MSDNELITPNDELIQLAKDGHFFNLCIAFALNKGHRNAIKEKKEVKFSIGNYEVAFNHDKVYFTLNHKVYFARIINAHFQESIFIGDDENEVIADVVAEVENELTLTTKP